MSWFPLRRRDRHDRESAEELASYIDHETDLNIERGMSPEDAAAVVQKLRESGTEYRLTENGTGVLVPSARVAELRLQMAGAGLPKTGRVGFELFDQTNFGVTDFAEHINYRRAVEGELERSIMALAETCLVK